MAATERPRHCKRSYSCCHSPVRREITPGDRFGASFPKIAASASWSEGMTASGPKECPNAHRDAAQIEHGQQGIEIAIYTLRNMVERCFNKLKSSRRLATRQDKTACSIDSSPSARQAPKW
jgi:transposase